MAPRTDSSTTSTSAFFRPVFPATASISCGFVILSCGFVIRFQCTCNSTSRDGPIPRTETQTAERRSIVDPRRFCIRVFKCLYFDGARCQCNLRYTTVLTRLSYHSALLGLEQNARRYDTEGNLRLTVRWGYSRRCSGRGTSRGCRSSGLHPQTPAISK
jgi:hypothetical protein